MNTPVQFVSKYKTDPWAQQHRLRYCHMIFADDATYAIAHSELRILEQAAEREEKKYSDGIKSGGLNTAMEKSKNFVIAPLHTVGQSFFRRQPDARRGRVTQVRSRDRELGSLRRSNGEHNGKTREQQRVPTLGKRPFPMADEIRILGVDLDPKLSFTAHTMSIVNRTKIRVGIISTLSGCIWEDETGIQRLTGKSLVISLLRHALAMVGS